MANRITRYASLRVFGLVILAIRPVAGKDDSKRFIVSSGTIILIGASTSDIILAADSAVSSNLSRTTRGATKIYPISKFTACTINNTAMIRAHRGPKVVDTADFGEIVRQWAQQNPEVSLKQANALLSVAFANELKRFYSINRETTDFSTLVSLVCVGYDLGSPIIFVNDFHESLRNTNFEPYEQHINRPLPPGRLFSFGENKVCLDVLNGSSPELEGYTQLPVVQNYRKLLVLNQIYKLFTDELIQLSKVCMEATESPAGKIIDPHSDLVAPPNHYAVISQKSGFRELSSSP